jgi:transposase
MRIQFTGETVKILQAKRQVAYQTKDQRLLRKISVLLAVGLHHLKVEKVAADWGLSAATVYNWLNQLLVRGITSIHYRHAGGRPNRLSLAQKKQLCAWLEAGPQACGFETECWSSILIAQLILKHFKVTYHRHYLIALLKSLGYSYQKGEFESSHLDPAKRQDWMEQVWPQLLAKARASGGLLVFVDEVSFAQWGSLSYTWARKGQTPKIKTSGKRKGYKVFGAIDYFSGRLFYQGIEGKFNSQTYRQFVTKILEASSGPIFLVQDGARYHTSRETQQFFEEHQARLFVYRLPAYSPDYNPIEYLWRKTKRQATHNAYFGQFEDLVKKVDQALNDFASRAESILGLFGHYQSQEVVTT